MLDYIEEVCKAGKTDIIFYSDNCSGQQKNGFMLALYIYEVDKLDINSITHKYLIKGHTQNEGDSAHSLIERQVKRILKSGPIYTPEGLITAIRTAKKKGDPFKVKELCYDDFYNIKILPNEVGPMNIKAFRISEVKVLKVMKESPTSVFYKYSYAEEYQEVKILKDKNHEKNIQLVKCFKEKPGITSKKKDGLVDLCEKNLIIKPYHLFYKNL